MEARTFRFKDSSLQNALARKLSRRRRSKRSSVVVRMIGCRNEARAVLMRQGEQRELPVGIELSSFRVRAGSGLFEWLRLMVALMARMDTEGAAPARPLAPVLIGFFMRLGIAVAVLYVSLKFLDGSVYALVAGLALGVAALGPSILIGSPIKFRAAFTYQSLFFFRARVCSRPSFLRGAPIPAGSPLFVTHCVSSAGCRESLWTMHTTAGCVLRKAVRVSWRHRSMGGCWE